MFSKFSHNLEQALPSSTAADSSSTAMMTAVAANRGHHPTTPDSSFLTSSSLTESTSSHFVGERKEEEEEEGDSYEGKKHPPVADTSTASNTEEVVVMSAALLRIVKHGYSVSWFKQRICPYVGFNEKDTIELRRSCRLFRDSLDPPLWAWFPNSKYKSLNGFMDTLNSAYEQDPSKAPRIVFVMKGTFHGHNSEVNINYPLVIIGAGQTKTFLTVVTI